MFENKSILEITSLIKSKETTVKEVVKFYLERIKKYNPALNAIVLQKEEEQIFDEVNVKDKEDDKLKPLVELKYNTIADAKKVLGSPVVIRETFISFQKFLYDKAIA